MIDESKLKSYFQNKNILVTGGTGSIGQQIVASLLAYNPRKIVVFSKDDSKQYLMKQAYKQHDNIFYLLGDVRDYDSVEYATRGMDLVFHVAALKQVPVCEENPLEAVKTNIMGSENVIRACIHHQVKKVVNVSTDKAVNPTNTMGATKLLSEKMFKNANRKLNNHNTLFCSVRFGNVLNSRGSVIPLFMEQARHGKDLTVTDPSMSRFIMTIADAAQLTLKSSYYSKGGEIFIFKMKGINILQLAEAVQKYIHQKGSTKPKIEQIGKRPGEKIYEELIYTHELEHIMDDEELYVILPEHHNTYHHFKQAMAPSIRSDQVSMLGEKEIIDILKKLDVEKAD
ncbi:SDR family NAD(P)-dependent oxidoreductase [Thalassobacillus pellis]|uniref:SDR family NAD(P)-dependent oxidoreductase n=1 Tax=Thalassobacillus pellis TaxID=748008 RepID=UPI00195FF666|nr:SDR family NAD(P)-dependent oxidoreductase [Thalassobacillus pellis]MBM7552587.1 FlaA1/EpsC-like NDP-sugar epimerase [Thalassobacillus pellis]